VEIDVYFRVVTEWIIAGYYIRIGVVRCGGGGGCCGFLFSPFESIQDGLATSEEWVPRSARAVFREPFRAQALLQGTLTAYETGGDPTSLAELFHFQELLLFGGNVGIVSLLVDWFR